VNLLLKIIGLYTESYAKNTEVKESFYRFIDLARQDGLISMKLRQSYEDQQKENKGKLDGKN
jgi:hypothetical protein